MFSYFSYIAYAVVTDLVLLLFTYHDDCPSSFNILRFLFGTGVSNFATDIEGIFPISASPLVSATSISSSIKVPLHSGEGSMVNISASPYVIIAPTILDSTIAASNAAPVSASAAGASIIAIPSTGFVLVAASSNPSS